jgi:uncharacterized protein YbcV (DUF1398 family)
VALVEGTDHSQHFRVDKQQKKVAEVHRSRVEESLYFHARRKQCRKTDYEEYHILADLYQAGTQRSNVFRH